MTGKKNSKPSGGNTGKGNYVSEWFGHRTYPTVRHAASALHDQENKTCPFLSRVTRTNHKCIKPLTSLGVCTINSPSNGLPQDWLVCPYRALEDSLLTDVIDTLFGAAKGTRSILAASTLNNSETRAEIQSSVEHAGSAIVYFQNKLGGEISISKTDRSPELSFDITLAEIANQGSVLGVRRYGILEIQTMDFHGSYQYVVKNLTNALHLHKATFHSTLQTNQHWLAEKIEGPNIANVFKRTFYQMMFKFQIGANESSVGSVLAIPKSVWDSWQRHLGKPTLLPRPDGNFELRQPDAAPLGDYPPAWIYLFDLDPSGKATPDPVTISMRIATTAEAVGHFALKVAPEAAVGKSGAITQIPDRIVERLRDYWPEFGRLLPDE